MTARFPRRGWLVPLCLGMVLLGLAPASAQEGPVVGQVPVGEHPAIPAGLKLICFTGPSTFQSSATCPVIEWGGYTYWAFSHRDNRTAMTLVAHDPAGEPVDQWLEPGARYLWRITVDAQAETVTLWGQANKTITIPWAQIRPPAAGVTTVFVVRHAEKETGPDLDPPLTERGERRAETLARMLASSGVSVVYSTDATRTRETVNNYADLHGIDVQIYGWPREVVDSIRAHDLGRAILVAGHAHTVPTVLQELGVESPPQVGDEFDNLFIVHRFADGRTALVHLDFEPADLVVGGPDLVVDSFRATGPVDCNAVFSRATLPVRVVLRNRGDEAADGFATEVRQTWPEGGDLGVCFHDPRHTGPDGEDVCRPWVEDPVAPGGTVTLEGEVRAWYLIHGSFSLTATADSGECGTRPEDPCFVPEVDEHNNASSPLVATCP